MWNYVKLLSNKIYKWLESFTSSDLLNLNLFSSRMNVCGGVCFKPQPRSLERFAPALYTIYIPQQGLYRLGCPDSRSINSWLFHHFSLHQIEFCVWVCEPVTGIFVLVFSVWPPVTSGQLAALWPFVRSEVRGGLGQRSDKMDKLLFFCCNCHTSWPLFYLYCCANAGNKSCFCASKNNSLPFCEICFLA